MAHEEYGVTDILDQISEEDQLAKTASAVFRVAQGPQQKSPSLVTTSAPLIPHRDKISDWLEKDGLT